MSVWLIVDVNRVGFVTVTNVCADGQLLSETTNPTVCVPVDDHVAVCGPIPIPGKALAPFHVHVYVHKLFPVPVYVTVEVSPVQGIAVIVNVDVGGWVNCTITVSASIQLLLFSVHTNVNVPDAPVVNVADGLVALGAKLPLPPEAIDHKPFPTLVVANMLFDNWHTAVSLPALAIGIAFTVTVNCAVF